MSKTMPRPTTCAPTGENLGHLPQHKERCELSEDKVSLYSEQLLALLQELLEKAGQLRHRRPLLVVGCSTSEIVGGQIGQLSCFNLGQELAQCLVTFAKEHEVDIAVQCCEHLNRALVLPADVASARQYTEVTAVPWQHAGGSLATAYFELLPDPVLVESVEADLGLDLGQTLIGMHLKRVAVPLRLQDDKLGEAIITAAKTRPPLVGGARARYER